MLVREIMTAPAVSVRADSSPHHAILVLAERRLTLLPVVDERDVLVGVISEADLLRVAVAADPRAHLRVSAGRGAVLPQTVGELMTREPHTTTESGDVSDIARIFASTSFKCLPVVRGDDLVGVISRSDVVRALARTDDDLAGEIASLLADLGPPRWDVTVTEGMVSITGSGSVRDGDAAAALAATVMGVRRVEVRPTTEAP